MANQGFESVDQYIASQPKAAQDTLKRVRRSIRKAVPDALEGISYKMPAYTLGDDPLLQFALWKHHYAIYAATQGVLMMFGQELARYQVDKGTIRFPLLEAVPTDLIERIAKFRAQEIMERKSAHRSA